LLGCPRGAQMKTLQKYLSAACVATFIVLGTGAISTSASNPASSALLNTDRSGYAPGDVVTITGSGFPPGEIAMLSIQADGFLAWAFPVVADAGGNIFNSQFIVQNVGPGATFKLTATGQESPLTATTTFVGFSDGSASYYDSSRGFASYDSEGNGYYIWDTNGDAGDQIGETTGGDPIYEPDL